MLVSCISTELRGHLSKRLVPYAEVSESPLDATTLFVEPNNANSAAVIGTLLAGFQARRQVTVVEDDGSLEERFLPHCRMAEPSAFEAHTRSVDSGNLPPVLGAFYNYPEQQGSAPRVAVISLGGTYLTSDMEAFWALLELDGPMPQVNYVRADSRTTSAPDQPITSQTERASQENTLDIQIIMGLAPKASITVYFASNSLLGFYYAFSRAIADNNAVISCSWGIPEIYLGSSAYVYNNLYKSAVERGISICVASGDYGSGDRASTRVPVADFPSSSPYVVSCGGTSVDLVNGRESTWSWNPLYGWGTGGGLSRLFARPAYQASTVTVPTNTVPSIGSLANQRSTPDIALNSDPLTGWSVFYDGQLYRSRIGGTSCAAPAFAALLALINRSWAPPHGVHSFLYSRSVGFRDITEGSNNSLTNSVGVFDARVGYDQCTGLGSVDATVLFLSEPESLPAVNTAPLLRAKAMPLVELQLEASASLQQWLSGRLYSGVSFSTAQSEARVVPGVTPQWQLGAGFALCDAQLLGAMLTALDQGFRAWPGQGGERTTIDAGELEVHAQAPLVLTKQGRPMGWRLVWAAELGRESSYTLSDAWMSEESALSSQYPDRPFVELE